MSSLTPYMASAGLFVLAVVLIRNTSPYSAHGGSSYEWRARRRVWAAIFFALAAICGLYGGVNSLATYLNAPLFPAPLP